MEGFLIKGLNPLLPECGGNTMALFSTNLLERVSGLYHIFGEPISCQNCG